MTTKLHLLAFDVPYPADYGGAIDVFYKLKALHEAGVLVVLHCFEYGDRNRQESLEKYAHKVYYYPRNMAWTMQLSFRPFIVKSRQSKALLERLLEDKYPILMEGIHCCGHLSNSALNDRIKLVRMHNIEWQYYRDLAKMEQVLWKRLFLKVESWKLKVFEKQLKNATHCLAISEAEMSYLKSNSYSTTYIPPFHKNSSLQKPKVIGAYALFHANLSVPDNELAALEIIKGFTQSDYPLIIAGKSPTKHLQNIIQNYKNIQLIANLTESDMQSLIDKAHVHILWTMQSAGMKLKLLNSLFSGRHCIVNDKMIVGTNLAEVCQVIERIEDLPNILEGIDNQLLSESDWQQRKNYLEPRFSNAFNANELLKLL